MTIIFWGPRRLRSTSRVCLRESVPPSVAARAVSALLWDPMHFVMQRGMLMGIARRAEERMTTAGRWTRVARIGWIAAAATGDWGITVFGAVVWGRRWWPIFLLLATSVALVLLVAPDPYLAFGFLLGGGALALPIFTDNPNLFSRSIVF